MRIINLNSLLLLLVVIFCSGNRTNAQPAITGGTWQEVSELSDEFTTFDTSKWFKPLWNYSEPNQMVDANSGVTNGNLWIKATLNAGSSRWFTSSRVQSRTLISYPMYTECSMKASSISALNTFWLNSGDANDRDEIDICENNAAPTGSPQHGAETPFINASNWWYAEGGNQVNGNSLGDTDNHNSTKDLSAGNPLKGLKMDEAYHTIGCYWEDERTFHWYLNGELVGSSTIADPNIFFTRDLAIIWDLWTNPWDGFATQASLQDDNLNTMYIDWIHTYKFIPGGSDQTFNLGNPHVDGFADSWFSNMVINKTDTYTNNSGSSENISIDTFNFYAENSADPVTPFVVKVNGVDDFTVLAVGTTRSNTDYGLGVNSFDFFDGTPKTIDVANGETIAVGFLDSNADGSGGGVNSVVAYGLNDPKDNVWYSGGGFGADSGSVSEGLAPVPGSNTVSLDRNYSFNIDLKVNSSLSTKDFDLSRFAFNIFPNPANETITLKFNSLVEDKTILNVFDVSGRAVLTTLVGANKLEKNINISQLPMGVYFIKIKGSNVTTKLIKQR